MLAALTRDEAEAPPYRPHHLHASDRVWPETNCYVDLWIELLHGRGLVPEAMLGFTLRQDFEGDQFTFFKPHAADIERLYGLEVQELALYESLEAHALTQAARGNPVLVEVDAFFLPDTRGTTYRRESSKTTIATLTIDPRARRLDYLHNAGRFTLAGDDYEGLFAKGALFPYAEFVKPCAPPLPRTALGDAALDLLHAHRRRAPRRNPALAFRDSVAEMGDAFVQRPLAAFHRYGFNTTRQLGANAEMLASHLDWLRDEGIGGFTEAAGHCRALAQEAKTFQFQLARAFSRGRAAGLSGRLDAACAAYDEAFAALDRALA